MSREVAGVQASFATFAGLDSAAWTAVATIALCVFTGVLVWVTWQQVKLGRQQAAWLVAERERARRSSRADARVLALSARRTLLEAQSDLDQAARTMAETPIERFRRMAMGLQVVQGELFLVHAKLAEAEGNDVPGMASAIQFFQAAADSVNRLGLGSDDAKAWVQIPMRIAAAEQARENLRQAMVQLETGTGQGPSRD